MASSRRHERTPSVRRAQVPTVHIYDGSEVHLLADLPCQPSNFKTVEAQVKQCIEARRQELSSFAMVGGMMGRELLQEERRNFEGELRSLGLSIADADRSYKVG